MGHWSNRCNTKEFYCKHLRIHSNNLLPQKRVVWSSTSSTCMDNCICSLYDYQRPDLLAWTTIISLSLMVWAKLFRMFPEGTSIHPFWYSLALLHTLEVGKRANTIWITLHPGNITRLSIFIPSTGTVISCNDIEVNDSLPSSSHTSTRGEEAVVIYTIIPYFTSLRIVVVNI